MSEKDKTKNKVILKKSKIDSSIEVTVEGNNTAMELMKLAKTQYDDMNGE